MKLKLKKKNMKSLTNGNQISKDMTPQVAGGIVGTAITTGGPRPTETAGCSMVLDCQMSSDDMYCKLL